VECEALASIGETLLAVGDLIGTEQVFRNAEEVATARALPLQQARIREGYAHVAAARGDHALARRYWEEALRWYPAEAADARHSRRHLVALAADTTADCLRCATRQPASTQ
jgi:hypothetical protein